MHGAGGLVMHGAGGLIMGGACGLVMSGTDELVLGRVGRQRAIGDTGTVTGGARVKETPECTASGEGKGSKANSFVLFFLFLNKKQHSKLIL